MVKHFYQIILAKAAYAPLTLFCAVSATARVPFCHNSFGCCELHGKRSLGIGTVFACATMASCPGAPISAMRSPSRQFRQSYTMFTPHPISHFANRLVDRALDELVEPFRAFNFKEQEIVLMKAIVALNPCKYVRTIYVFKTFGGYINKNTNSR
jgi:hypothetical protein